MSFKSNINKASLAAQSGFNTSTKNLQRSFERLSSGLRINNSSDDPASLALANKLKSDSLVYGQARRNVNDGITLLNYADQAVDELKNITLSIRDLAGQAANGGLTNQQRSAINTEAQALSEEFRRIASETEYNDKTLFSRDLEEISIQAGSGGNSAIALDLTLGGTVSDDTFQAGVTVANESARWVESADIDGDGIVDLLAVDDDIGNGDLRFYKGVGDGTFTAGQTVELNNGPRVVKLADVNNDGNLDLINTNQVDGTVTIVTGNGDGTFSAATSIAISAVALGLEVGDFNQDGNIDFAVSDTSGQSVSVLMGNGDGTFGTITSYSTNGNAYDIESGDYNNDGIIDLAVSNVGANDEITILLGDGDGTFTEGATISSGDQPFYFGVGDINNDGNEDFAIGNFNQDTISIALGNGDGTFQGITSFSTGASTGPDEVKVVDMNGDGNADLVFSLYTSDQVGITYGNGDGTFGAIVSYAAGNQANGVEINDLNNDGVLDIIVTGEGGALTTHIANTTSGLNTLNPFDLTSKANAEQALAPLDRAIDELTVKKGNINSLVSRLEVTNNHLSNLELNAIQASNKIMDLDVAEEAVILLKNKILQSTSEALMAQANLQQNIVLDLISGSLEEK